MKKPTIYMADTHGAIIPVLVVSKEEHRLNGYRDSTKEEYLEQCAALDGEAPEVDDADAGDDGEEGDYSLVESVEKCRGFAALEAIVEGNPALDVDLDGLSFKEQKAAVLEAISAASEEE